MLAGPLPLRRDGRELAGVLAGVGHDGVVILERGTGDAQERLELDQVLLDPGDEERLRPSLSRAAVVQLALAGRGKVPPLRRAGRR